MTCTGASILCVFGGLVYDLYGSQYPVCYLEAWSIDLVREPVSCLLFGGLVYDLYRSQYPVCYLEAWSMTCTGASILCVIWRPGL